jgi:hypothetical protein
VQRLLPFQNGVVNRVVVALAERGLVPLTYALLETTGRRTGRPRRIPVANGLDADTFWLIVGRGEQAASSRTSEPTQRSASRHDQPCSAKEPGCDGDRAWPTHCQRMTPVSATIAWGGGAPDTDSTASR